MARRPRVPKSGQRVLVEANAAAAPRGQVGSHSAKVIPLDSAPSLHGEPRIAPADITGRHPDTTGSHTPAAPVSGPQQPPAPGSDRSPAGPDTAAPARQATLRDPGPDPTPASAPPRASHLTPAQRRAAARRDLMRHATRGRARPDRARGASPSATGSSAASAPPATARSTGSRATAGQTGSTGSAGSTAARPSAQRPAPAAVEPVPARYFTGRSVALLVVLFVAAVLLAPTLRVFLDQQAEIRAVREDIAAQETEQHELTEQIARWQDPAYVRQQARDRLNLVMPGEKTYMVIGGEESIEDTVPAPVSPDEVNPEMPWADALWDSVVRAGTD